MAYGKQALIKSRQDIFHYFSHPQKSTSHVVKLLIPNREIKQEKYIKYLGLHIDSHLSWKFHVLHISKKKLSAVLEDFLKLGTLLANRSLFSPTTHLFILLFTYSLITWGNTYPPSLQPLITLLKKIK